MIEQSFDAFTRGTAAGATRRGTLLTLGGAALAAAVGGSVTSSAKMNNKKKNNKKDKKKEKKKAEQKCEQQVAECQSILNSVAAPTPEQLLCCDSLSTCNAALFISCIFTP
jgi:hypothetical protein